MGLTLTEAAKLSNDVVLQGVYESIIKQSDVSLLLPYEEFQGNAITYNRENVAPTVAWFAVGDSWTEGVATFTQVTKQLCIVGGDADVDKYLELSRSNVQDLKATIILGKAQALQREWDNEIVNGTGAANKPEGLDKIITDIGATQPTMGVNGATLTLTKMDELYDFIQGGAPDAFLMSKRSRRTMMSLVRTAGMNIAVTPLEQFGRYVTSYNGVPLLISEWISDAQTVGTSVDCSVIYALKFGQENGGLYAAYNSGGAQTPIMVDDIGTLETKDASRTRLKAYVQLCQGSAVKIGKLVGVRP